MSPSERLNRIEKDLTDLLSRSISRADTIAITDALKHVINLRSELTDPSPVVTVNEYTAGGTA
jgi:hypothetical protein